MTELQHVLFPNLSISCKSFASPMTTISYDVTDHMVRGEMCHRSLPASTLLPRSDISASSEQGEGAFVSTSTGTRVVCGTHAEQDDCRQSND